MSGLASYRLVYAATKCYQLESKQMNNFFAVLSKSEFIVDTSITKCIFQKLQKHDETFALFFYSSQVKQSLK